MQYARRMPLKLTSIIKPGGRLPYKMDEGAHGKFWKETLRATKILFCERRLKLFSPHEVHFLKQREMKNIKGETDTT